MKLPPETERRVRWDALRFGFNAAMVSAVVFVLIEFHRPLMRYLMDGVITLWRFFQ